MSIRDRRTSEHDYSKFTKSSSFSRLERNGSVFGPLTSLQTREVVQKLIRKSPMCRFRDPATQRQTNIDFWTLLHNSPKGQLQEPP